MSNIKITEVPDPVKADGGSKFDPTRPVQTRDGRKARILATDLCGVFPIAFAAMNYMGTEDVFRCGPTGRVNVANYVVDNDLVNVPEQRVVDFWLNLYPDGALERHGNEAEAVYYRGPGAVTVRVQKTFNV